MTLLDRPLGDEVRLDDRYRAVDGRALMSGIQALVRSVLEQRRLDDARGLHTAAFISGYEGSPLGGVDIELHRITDLTDDAGIVFRPGLNEELAATSVGGTQAVGRTPGHRYAGVTGYWYGKSPGLDRAADAIRHATMAGTAPAGGAVAWIGDDPTCKSSTIPSSCEPMARSLLLPLLAPSTVAEIVDFNLHAVAMSRWSGAWVGLKIVADIADASATVDVSGLGAQIPDLGPVTEIVPAGSVGPAVLEKERHLVEVRLPRALHYARAAGLNRISRGGPQGTAGIVAAGLAHAVVLRALDGLGLDDDACRRIGLRVIKLGMPWPLDPAQVRDLTAGLDQIVVVEDKVGFVEGLVKEALFDLDHRPCVVGATDERGRPLLPVHGAVDADTVARVVRDRVAGVDPAPPARRVIPITVAAPERTPYFCSGCPHNISTRAADDQLVGAGIGCHTMVMLAGTGRGDVVGLTQMGGEGAQWIGMAPFTDDRHFVQNLGDGTFFHSGSLAVRAAVAAGVDLTYKLLYNEAVAMTGGQRAEGRMAVPRLTRWLAQEGVSRVIVTTPEPGTYRGVTLDPIAEVRHRDQLQAAQEELAATPGVTVLIHDDRCATEERRMRKRGTLPAPVERVWINQRVCEGCGDCGDTSSCLSVLPVETDLGRKTAIHQSSCNQDFSCLDGDCPSFVMVTPAPEGGRGERRRRGPASVDPAHRALPVELRDPDGDGRELGSDGIVVRMPGIGGTGVVTVSQLLQMAAHVDGLHAAGLEQTGLAQKGGPVVSDVRLSTQPIDAAVRATGGSVDVLVAFDSLSAAAADNLAAYDRDRTVAIINTDEVPTAAMVADPTVPATAGAGVDRIDAATRTADNLRIPAQWIAERLFGDHLPTNMVLVGAAFQHGCLPLSAAAIDRAIELNGAAVEANRAAFRWGRAAALDLDAVRAELAPAPPPPTRPRRGTAPLVARVHAADLPDDLDEVVRWRVEDLVAYHDARYAERYLDDVLTMASAEAGRHDRAGLPVTDAYARNLYKLLAYKDEYEVARLHRDAAEAARLSDEFGTGTTTRVMLHPPVLRTLGLRRKVSLGRATGPAFAALRSARRLRGTPLDPFGHSAVRRLERSLPDDYRAALHRALPHLGPDTVTTVVALAGTPDLIRGYEAIKVANVARFRQRVADLEAELGCD